MNLLTRMTVHRSFIFFLLIGILISMVSCTSSKKEKERDDNVQSTTTQVMQIEVPIFNEDTAFNYIKAQVDFGPRVPNTKAHAACAEYFVSTLKKFTPAVSVQTGKVTTYDGITLNLKNIIASFNVESKNRILLFAHWDTRPWADLDPKQSKEANLGADDGGSGVGVLLEVARQFSLKVPTSGVDIIFFDAEDWGKSGGGPESEDSYCLGSQYWIKNLHTPGYTANYGILLDMVGGRGSRFLIEGNSKNLASFLVDKVWKTAANLGYSGYFISQEGGWVTDDHVYVNRANIPSIDIIGSSASSQSGFPAHWHTQADNMDIIDKATLKAVGQTVLHVVYSETGI
ncbi:MAG: M28 family peptidase [Bacteroidia bacterium]|nr:M28 family peptidase [Bacteroidia bacterium]